MKSAHTQHGRTDLEDSIRLQKWLAQKGVLGRREADRLICEGRISLNGVVVASGAHVPLDFTGDGLKIDQEQAAKWSNRPHLADIPKVYWLLHKPDLRLVSNRPQGDKKTIFELPCLAKVKFPISPVGRLDYRTEGLLLLSNDGNWVHSLMHPKFKVPRQYQVLLNQKLTSIEESTIRKGRIALQDGPVKPSPLKYLGSQKMGRTAGAWYLITVFEGRNRLVRRIFESLDRSVVRLVRTGFGPLSLPESLPPGAYRQLTSLEIKRMTRCQPIQSE